ncbi:MAG: cell division protein ZapA [Sphingomonadales bacterium]|nr:cell division protein ZapA [Sphingomonadales bacterium]
MSNVTLSIGGRDYAVACAPGEETHVAGLGRLIDSKLSEMPGGQAHGETRSLLFAALLLADQVHELEQAQAIARAAPLAAAPAPAPAFPTERLASLAERLERLAGTIEAQG